ncbi:hypothetical protein A9X04_13375 [Mycobacterium sp. E3247]|nr:hypothetical protein A9X04_13375 [Mycobacterium sp. E3247]
MFATSGELASIRGSTTDQTWTGWCVLLNAGMGLQPAQLLSDCGRIVIMAGEIYNRDELSRTVEGDSFSDDAELLSGSMKSHGLNAFRSINGRYAAVIGDGPRLTIATDHAGSVPVYIKATDCGISVSTEIKALSSREQSATGRRRIDGAPLVPIADGILRVPAGTALSLDVSSDMRSLRTIRTWSPQPHRVSPVPSEAVKRLRQQLSHAVQVRVAGSTSTPTCVLSGGIDSGAVSALTAQLFGSVDTVSMGTDLRDEFSAARDVADHVARYHPTSTHTELIVKTDELLDEIPWAVWASEASDPAVLEYLLPLTSLYRRLQGRARRIITGYGADIPLGGMHRGIRELSALEDAIFEDMSTFDGLNEMSPALSGASGHWSTHPFWDRDVLDLLVSLEAGLKKKDGVDKWVLREAMADLLPESTIRRPKTGIHEGTGVSDAFTELLRCNGIPREKTMDAKRVIVSRIYRETVLDDRHPDDLSLHQLVEEYGCAR